MKIKVNENSIWVEFRPGVMRHINVVDGYVDTEDLRDYPMYEHIVGLKHIKNNDYSIVLTPEGQAKWNELMNEKAESRRRYFEKYGCL